MKPKYPANGKLRMFNMFPYRRYTEKKGIDGMIEYIPAVKKMGYNAVWINPLQATGTKLRDHPDGSGKVNGSIYAMADAHQFNPIIFPDCSRAKAEAKLVQWTDAVRSNQMFPLFDLVLNHVGLNEGDESALFGQLDREDLLLKEGNKRWPDIIGIDYYSNRAKNHGLDATEADLDYTKIDRVFTILWEPLITRYIKDYGFMGARIDALTHVPAVVQKRAYELIERLVTKYHDTRPMIVGELMVGNPESYIEPLSSCGLTHTLHPSSFFWGHAMDGGYNNESIHSPFLKQNRSLAEITLSPSPSTLLNRYRAVEVIRVNEKREISLKANTIYIFVDEKSRKYSVYLNRFNKSAYFKDLQCESLVSPVLIKSIDIIQVALQEIERGEANIRDSLKFIKTIKATIQAEDAELKKWIRGTPQWITRVQVLDAESEENSEIKNAKKQIENIRNKRVICEGRMLVAEGVIKKFLDEMPGFDKYIAYCSSTSQKNRGGLVAVLGNHDVGTLKAKIMLDIAYGRALSKAAEHEKGHVHEVYKRFKNAIIKGIRNTNELIERLQIDFGLSDMEKHHLFLEVNLRMREKLFIQAIACSGGWYSMAGDELGVCHKPEVFKQFGEDDSHVGSSLKVRADSTPAHHDLRQFISGINTILDRLPFSSFEDNERTTLHYDVVHNEEFGVRPAEFLFVVVQYNKELDTYFIIGHTPEEIAPSVLTEKLTNILKGHPCYTTARCSLFLVNPSGIVHEGSLFPQADDIEKIKVAKIIDPAVEGVLIDAPTDGLVRVPATMPVAEHLVAIGIFASLGKVEFTTEDTVKFGFTRDFG